MIFFISRGQTDHIRNKNIIIPAVLKPFHKMSLGNKDRVVFIEKAVFHFYILPGLIPQFPVFLLGRGSIQAQLFFHLRGGLFYVGFGKPVHQIAAKPHKKRNAYFNIIPEVQNILVSFLLFRSGNRDLQIGQKMVHEKVTKKSGEHFLHGIADTAVIYGLAKGVYIFI